jgi:tetratricopeptide (TPR) repeat protein
MADLQQFLAILEVEPKNAQALAALESFASTNGSLTEPAAKQALEDARKIHRDRGELELVARLFDLELGANQDAARRADLLLEKGRLLSEELLEEDAAVRCFREVLELRPEDAEAQESLANLELVRGNWEKIVKKYLDEAKTSTDRQLTTSLFLSAAETYARYQKNAPEVEQYLKKALEVEPKNRRAGLHLERVLRAAGRWDELGGLLEARIDAAASKEERIGALLALADVAQTRLAKPGVVQECMRKVLAIDPSHPRAMQVLVDSYSADQNWAALVKVYEGALKVRARTPDGELANVLQIAMIYWKRLGQLDQAEEYFRRVRKAEPAHPAAIDFYREYHKERGEGQKLLQVLQTAHRAETDPGKKSQLALEMAGLAESEVGNPEKAIDSWKGILRQDPKNPEARAALKRLYQRTEKWNALLELLKDEIESIPASDDAGKQARVALLLEVVAVYRDRLNLDVMVINTYNTILSLRPDEATALDALAVKFEQLGRWNDLTNVLTRKAASAATPKAERVALLRRIASLWADRSGNHAQAIKPLEDLLALEPGDREALAKLKDIYTRRRQWRALIELMGRELGALAEAERRGQLAEMATLASDRLGDARASIAIWNRVLEEAPSDALALASLASLYEKEKRWPALAEIYHRQRESLAGPGGDDPRAAVAVLERLGTLYAERLEAPALAAAAFDEVLRLQPGHTKAMRVLRELYAHAGDLDALERLYGTLGAWDDLIEVFYTIAERQPDPAKRLAVLERAAALAAAKLSASDRIARAYERIMGVDPHHPGAARALVPLYRKGEKWARLLSTYEVVLGHTPERAPRLELLAEIRKLCEEKIGSKAMAFQWCAAAYELAPDDEALLKELERLGAEADAWEKVTEILERRAAAETVGASERLRLLRQLGRLYATRLHRADPSRAAWDKVLLLAPDDPEAMQALEDLNVHQGRWAEVLVIYRRRAELEPDRQKKLDLLFKIAFIEEERVADLEAAAKAYDQILGIDRRSQRALRGLSKVQGARGDAEGLAKALELELATADDVEQKLGLLLRLGNLYEERLGKRELSFERYRTAFDLSPGRREVVAALEKFMEPAAAEKVEVARLLSPGFDKGDEPAKLAKALEILRAAESDDAGRLAFDRRLAGLYAHKLKDPLAAYEAASRVLQAVPADLENRRELRRLAEECQATDDLAKELEKALAVCAQKGVDARAQRELAAELAELLGDDLGQAGPAEAAWRRVLDLDPTDRRAYVALARLLRAGARWDDLRQVLERHEQNSAGPDERRELLLQLTDLFEGVLDDPAGATGTYQRVLEVEPGNTRAFRALERLFERAGRYGDLEQLLGRELEHAATDAERVGLLSRRAELRATHLGDKRGAVDLLEEVLARDPDHKGMRTLAELLLPTVDLKLRLARLLRPIYEADSQWRDVVRVLQAEREMAQTPAERVQLLARIAELQEERLADESAAFATWLEALATDAEDRRSRQHLERLARLLDRFGDATVAWETAITRAEVTDLALRAALLAEVARFYDAAMGDLDRATSAYERLIDVDPGNLAVVRPAAEALERLHDEREAWPKLIDILRKQADWAEAPAKRLAYLVRVATIQEVKLAEPATAITTWREILAEDGEHAGALDALERLHAGRDEHRDLVDVLRRRVELSKVPTDRRALLWRIAELQERELGQPTEAATAYLEILDAQPEDGPALAELARLYRAAERWSDLNEINERRLALPASVDERVALRLELGTVLRDRLSRREEALERFRQVLAEDPDNVPARAAIEAMLDDSELKLRAAEVLQPIYESGAEHQKLADLIELEAAALDDVRERVVRLRRVAQLSEGPLAAPDKAFDAFARAARLAVAEPEFKDLLAQLMRVAFERDRVADLVALYRDLAPDVLDAEQQRRMYLDIADLARGKLRDVDMARDYYRRVLDAQPDDPRAAEALERLYRETGEHQALRQILRAKTERPGTDLDGRRHAFIEIATLCEEKLGEPDEAVLAWEAVLELMPAEADAARALERLYSSRERWVELSELLERRLGFAEDLDEAVTLRFRLGELFEKKLSDPDRAVENYQAVLGGDPQHAGAIEALERYLADPAERLQVAEVLEPLYIARQNWAGLIRLAEIRLDAEQEPALRLQLTRRIARLHEDQLEDLEGAFRWYGKVFREDPEDRQTRDQLHRLATILDSWGALANVYQEYLEDNPGDAPAARDVARSLADLADRRLDDVERARGAFRRLLQLDPADATAFAQLEAMLTRAQRWFALIEAYEEALEATLDPSRRIDLFGRIARVQELKLSAPEKAIDAWRAVLEVDIDQTGAIDELDRLYQASKRWSELGDLLTTRIERAASPEQARALRVRIAEVLETRQGDTRAAIDQYEQVVHTDPANTAALAALERLVQAPDHRQRIAEILEPIYRQKDWWQKLVVILGARLEFIDDKAQRVDMLREVAHIHEQRGGDLKLALEALSRAWKEDVGAEEVYGELERLAAKMGAWEQLVEVLDSGVEGVYDYDLAARLLGRIGAIEEDKRGRRPAAIAAWNRVLEVKEDDAAALDALVRLYGAEQKYDRLVETLRRKADLISEVLEKKDLLYRVAELEEQALGRRTAAITTWKDVLLLDDEDSAALDALERLYRETGEARALVEILSRKIELCDEPTKRRALRFSAAAVWKDGIGDRFEAISLYRAVLEADANDLDALAALDDLYLLEKNWQDQVEIIDRRQALAADPAVVADLRYRAARVVETELGEPEQAIERYRQILADNPRHAPTRESLEALSENPDTREAACDVLEPVYRADFLWAPLAALYERRLKGGEPDRRRERFAALAEVHEQGRRDLALAFGAWARWFREDPDDEQAQAELWRLSQARGSWHELVALYQQKLAEVMDGDQVRRLAMKAAQILEEALGDLPQAAQYYEKALDAGGDEGPALAALDRVYERTGKSSELGEILAREADLALAADDQATFLFRLGDLRERTLGDAAGAVAAYRDVLERAPTHAAARGALERLVLNPSERARVVAILEPIYENEGDAARLCDVLEHKLSVETAPSERAQILARVVELAERRLSDKVRALDAAGRWLAEEPTSEQAAEEMLRLAGELGRWEEAAARFADVIGSVKDDEIVRDLSLRLGRVLSGPLRDPARAEAPYRRVLELDGHQPEALAALETVYRQLGDAARLVEILWRRADDEVDAGKKRAGYAEAARLREERLGDDAGAIAGWKEVLSLEEADGEAHVRLQAIYERTQAWEPLVEVLELAARHAPDKADELAARRRAAQILGKELGALDRAVDAWAAVCELAPSDEEPLLALEAVQRDRQDWLAVQEVLVRRVALAHGARDRLNLYRALAQLAENERKSPDEAIDYLREMLQVDNASDAGYAELERLFKSTSRWHELVELHERHADVRAALGDADGELGLLAQAADVWEGPLANPGAAAELLEKILRREPRHVPALARLARIYEHEGDWDRCAQVLGRALELGPRGKDAADIYYRLGRAAEGQGKPAAEAQAHYRQALAQDQAHAESLGALEKAAREQGDYALLAQLLERRDGAETEPAKKLAIATELAQIYREKLGQPAAALPYLERASALEPGNTQIADALADLYFAAGRGSDAEPIYRRLGEAAKAARRAKDVARYQQRLGALREAAGDTAEALKCYEDAYRVDPSAGAVLAGLGRLSLAAGDLDKAQRIYRSMLLQNIDASVGVSKADVYLQLGLIHQKKGEAPKAKSMFEKGLDLEAQHPGLRAALASLG